MVKKKILEVASAIFSEKGINNTKVLEIATQAGISKKTIYKYFESKEELVKMVYYEFLLEINSKMDKLVSSDASFVNKLNGVIEILSQELKIFTPTLIKDLRDGHIDFSLLIEPYMKNAVFDRFKNLVQSGIDSGDIKANMKLESIVLMYREAINSFVEMRSEIGIPGGFESGTALQILCGTLTTIFRGILHENSLKEFDEKVKTINF
jgi:AcrR family transcriptional regulator